MAQEMISLYALWDQLGEGGGSGSEAGAAVTEAGMREMEPKRRVMTEREIIQLVIKMRAERELDAAHPSNGMPVVVDKRLGRAQAV